uniref:Uncharacterized protein n=1 Tax=Candidatus Kentrum sp. LPFa TaxID=2126335 RepID=A0A450WUN2_9GAMM|nr:MAG: hypothetical protein BECKLPF1236B_GA0070989_12234 [Candidatus Kentron sp. LPFa]
MTTPPQAAADHIGPLLASEVEDVLSGAGLEESLGMGVVKRRLEENRVKDAAFIEKALSEGVKNIPPPEGKSKTKWQKSLKGNPHTLTEFIFGGSVDEAKNTDERFAALTTLRFPSTTEHRMTLGTVVCEDGGDFYWL